MEKLRVRYANVLPQARLIKIELKLDTKAFLLTYAVFWSIRYFHSLQVNAILTNIILHKLGPAKMRVW